MYIAHKRENDNEVQLLKTHLEETAELAKSFAEDFNAAELAYICGLFHDLGKYSDNFQHKIKNSTNAHVDHMTAGSKKIIELYLAENKKPVGKLLSYVISGHHGGMLDAGTCSGTCGDSTLCGRLKKETDDFSAFENELNIPHNLPGISVTPLDSKSFGFTLSTFVRFLYSCLVDADHTDTRQFMNNQNDYKKNIDIQELLDLFNSHISRKFDSSKGDPLPEKTSLINEKRTEIRRICEERSAEDQGLFTLTVPTGGGKTISSMAFALNHAKKHNLKRIFYVIPYTSIIEQNAKVFRDIFGDENVLEHHSNFDFSDSENDLYNIHRLASENWDIPITVTTNVQFFESLFSNKPSKCKKIHNLSKSVIILDEAQMLPLDYLTPCMRMLCEIVKNYNSTVVLCTATQPAIENILPGCIKVTEISDCLEDNFEFFKRVEIKSIGKMSDEELVAHMKDKDSFLCVVNTRKKALDLFNLLEKSEDTFHLSTLMCPAHRKEVIEKIRERLEKNLPCRVISTQLIEAGVDIDFPVVYRDMAGVDSILQAAGRCNRNGKLEHLGQVFVFEGNAYPKNIENNISYSKKIFEKYAENQLHKPEIIREYFNNLYDIKKGKTSRDKYNICNSLNEGAEDCEYDFADIASKFKLIKDDRVPILIPYNKEAEELINSLGEDNIKNNLRKLQPYTVNIYNSDFNKLKPYLVKISNIEIWKVCYNYDVNDNNGNYSKKTGLYEPKLGDAILFE